MVDIRFGRFRFDTISGALFVGDEAVDPGRRALALLRLLLERRGDVVPKAALIAAAWGGAAIEDSNLSVQIARLRRLLGDDDPPWIETAGRIGYRFRSEPVSFFRPGETALALVPLVALDADTRDAARGLTDDIAVALARFRSLDVMVHDGAASYALHGSLRQHDGALRLSVRLADGGGRIVWGETWDGPARRSGRWVNEIAASAEYWVQSAEAERRLAAGVAESPLEIVLRAYRHVPASRPQQNAATIAMFDRALAREPDNIALLSAACEARAHRIAMGWPALGDDDMARCEALARLGLKLAVYDAAARSRFGFALYRGGDRDAGLAVVQHAVTLNPNSITALIHSATSSMHWGSIRVAETQFRHALRLVPRSPDQTHVLGGLSRIRMIQGRFREALALAERALVFNRDYGGAHWTRVAASAQLGLKDETQRHLAAFLRSQPGVTVASVRRAQPTRSGRMASTLEGLEAAGLPPGA